MKKPGVTPRNLTAQTDRLMRQIDGNPVTTSLDSAIANCFPGLEFDVRVLDCRFFPGLVFQFVQAPLYPLPGTIPDQQGAHLLYVDYLLDPMLPETSPDAWVQDLLTEFRGPLSTMFMAGRWYLDWIEQGGVRLSTKDADGNYYDGHLVWRLVRGLELEGELTIGIVQRDGVPKAKPIVLKGRRRRYLTPAGVYHEAYRPGEFTQAMCNPWHHDFRDCACHYWAASHPDVVIRNPEPAERMPNGAPRDPAAAVTYVDWLRRRQPSGDVAAANTIGANRPFQIDHYEMNNIWETLPFVLEGREIEGDYRPTRIVNDEPHASVGDLVEELENELAPLELTLAVQYLYALFSLKHPDEVRSEERPKLADDLAAVRQQMTLIAVGEMTHLRWVNQLLWEIDRQGLGHKGWRYRPIVRLTKQFRQTRAVPVLQPLTPQTLQLFVDLERPQGRMASAYGRCLGTLKQEKFPRALYELAARIDDDGIGHYQQLRNMQRILGSYAGSGNDYPYLRPVVERRTPETAKALEIFADILAHIRIAYAAEAEGEWPAGEDEIQRGRAKMMELHAAAEAAARSGLGIPFFS